MKHGTLAVVIIGLVVGTCLCSVAEELKNDSRITAVAVRVTFSSRVRITDFGSEFSDVEPSSGMSDVYTFTGGQLRRNQTFEIEWAPSTIRIESVEWLDTAPAPSDGSGEDAIASCCEINVEFDSAPEIGEWCPGSVSGGAYGTFGCGEEGHALGLIEGLPHSLLSIETQGIGRAIGLLFGYLDEDNYYAFFELTSRSETFEDKGLLLIRVASGVPEVLRFAEPPPDNGEIAGSHFRVLVSDGDITCNWNQHEVFTMAAPSMPAHAGAGLFHWSELWTATINIFYFLRISTSSEGLDQIDDGGFTSPRLEVRNAWAKWQEEWDHVKHTITLLLYNSGDGSMHDVRYWAGISTYPGGDMLWDEVQRSVGSLDSQQSRSVHVSLTGPLYETSCPYFIVTYDGLHEPVIIEWDCYPP